MIEEIYNENSSDENDDDGPRKTADKLSKFIKHLHPNKSVDDILIDKSEVDTPKKVVVKSRKERRFLERKQKKSEKSINSGKVRETAEKEKERIALAAIKADTRAEIGKRLAPIIFGINNYK